MESEFKAGVVARIEARMQACAVINADLARACGTLRSTVSKWLNLAESNLPTLQQIGKLAIVLQTSADYLVGNTSDPSVPSAESLRLPLAQLEKALGSVNEAGAELRDVLSAQHDELLRRRRASVQREPKRSVAAQILSDEAPRGRKKSNGDGA